MTAGQIGAIVVATGSRHKLAELQSIANEFGLRLLSPEECRKAYSLGPWPDPEENGTTFQANARIKADAFFAWAGIPALGDDSGLEVDALGGRPGIYSARYAGEGASDKDRNSKLLQELKETKGAETAAGRRARFRCTLALCTAPGRYIESEGWLEGHILQEPVGEGGFGYDPIVYLDDLECTLAEVEFATTCSKGFRAKAARKLFALLAQNTK